MEFTYAYYKFAICWFKDDIYNTVIIFRVGCEIHSVMLFMLRC